MRMAVRRGLRPITMVRNHHLQFLWSTWFCIVRPHTQVVALGKSCPSRPRAQVQSRSTRKFELRTRQLS